MHQIIKLYGVHVSQLEALTAVVKKYSCFQKMPGISIKASWRGGDSEIALEGPSIPEMQTATRILDSRMAKDGSYTVALKIPMILESVVGNKSYQNETPVTVHLSRAIMDDIYAALGAFPQEATVTPR